MPALFPWLVTAISLSAQSNPQPAAYAVARLSEWRYFGVSDQQLYQLGNFRPSLSAGRVCPEHPAGRFFWMLFKKKALFFFSTWT